MEQDNSVKSRRIAKNTLMLYVRMLALMFVGLYTSRVVLSALGENDYGIYNVVGCVEQGILDGSDYPDDSGSDSRDFCRTDRIMVHRE